MNEKLAQRSGQIVKISILGILVNLLLAGFKALVGMVTQSIAITMDALNNLSDALSSVLTIAGTQLAGRSADKEHPLGHGRYEYLTTMVIAGIILYAGITALLASVQAIFHPVTPSYSALPLAIIGAAVLVKLALGTFVKKQGEKLQAGTLVASGKDALFDAFIALATLAAAGIYLATGWKLEAWLGAAISAVIVKSGFDMVRETLSQLLGERVDSALTKEIKATVQSFPEVRGAYDLMLHNYGPDMFIGSVQIEVLDTMTAEEIDHVSRHIQQEVLQKHHVILSSVGIYSWNTTDVESDKRLAVINHIVMQHEEVIQMHGFYFNQQDNHAIFDIIFDFSCKNPAAVREAIKREVEAEYPGMEVIIRIDANLID